MAKMSSEAVYGGIHLGDRLFLLRPSSVNSIYQGPSGHMIIFDIGFFYSGSALWRICFMLGLVGLRGDLSPLSQSRYDHVPGNRK